MNDWNGDGSYDSVDRYIDYKMSGGGSSGGGSGKNSGSGKGILLYLIAVVIVGAFCEPLGALMLVGLFWVWLCGGL